MLIHALLISLWIILVVVVLYNYKQRMQFLCLQNASKTHLSFRYYSLSYLVPTATLLLCYISLCALLITSPAHISDNKQPKSDYVFILDISNSMNACDIENNVSRIEAAKKTMFNILNDINEYSRIGLIAFAGQAHAIIPLTNDKAYCLQVLPTINTSYISNQSTNLQVAIETGIVSLENITADKQTVSKRKKKIIILTDGENHYGDIYKNNTIFKQKNIELFVIGVGTEQGASIPVDNNNGQEEHLKDINGREIITKLNVSMLKILSENYLLYPISLDDIKKITND